MTSARGAGRSRRPGDATRRIHPDLVARLTHCVWIANRELQRAARAHLLEHECGVKWQDFLVLTVVASAARARVHQQYIGERTGLDRTTIGQILGDLEADGLVERYPDPSDALDRPSNCSSCWAS